MQHIQVAIPVIDKKQIPLHRDQRCSLFQETIIKNYTNTTVYISDGAGNVADIAPTLGGPRTGKITVITRVVHQQRRFYDMYGHEITHSGTYQVDSYEIELTDLLTKKAIYIPALGNAIAMTAAAAVRYNPSNPNYRDRIVHETVESIISNLHDAPIKCDINDPEGRTDVVYFGVGDFVVSSQVRHDRTREVCCNLQIKNKYQMYETVKLDYNAILSESHSFSTDDHAEIIVSTKAEDIEAWRITRRLSVNKQYSKDELQKYHDMQSDGLKRTIAEQKDNIRDLELKIKELDRERLVYLERETAEKNKESGLRKEEHELRKMDRTNELYDLKRESEQLRVRKECVSASANDVATIGTIAKASAVILPLAVGAAYAMKTATATSACIAASPVVFGAATVACIGYGLYKARDVIWSGIKSIGSFFSGLFS